MCNVGFNTKIIETIELNHTAPCMECMEMSNSKQLFFASIYLFLHFTMVNQNKQS